MGRSPRDLEDPAWKERRGEEAMKDLRSVRDKIWKRLKETPTPRQATIYSPVSKRNMNEYGKRNLRSLWLR
jgi:hypothetical protein